MFLDVLCKICSGSSTNMLLENNKEIHADDNARGQSHQDASIAAEFRHRLLAMQENTQSCSDIDARSDDPQMCGLYVSDIYEYLRELEVKPKQRPLHDYIESVQEDITAIMRGVLVDWLVEAAEEYKLESETLYLTVSYIDRYLSLKTVNGKSLQLVGISAMLIASKYEEQKTRPKVEDFYYMTGFMYTKQQVLKMEEDILFALQFELGSPTINTFLRRFIRVAQEDFTVPNLQLEPLCCYLSELSILDYKTVKFVPSLLAASAVFLARFIIRPNQYPWNHMLEEYTKYKAADLQECVGIMHDLYLIRRGGFLQAVRNKYKHHKCVATIPVSPELPQTLWEECYHLISTNDFFQLPNRGLNCIRDTDQ